MTVSHNIRPEVARKLIPLLDELKQARNWLRICGEYCFLGAVCELFRRDVGYGGWEGPRFKAPGEMSCEGTLPRLVKEWATTDGLSPWFLLETDLVADAADLNDSHGWTFHHFQAALQEGLHDV